MDKEKVRQLVEEYAKLVISKMKVNKIILYGSYARGDYRDNSELVRLTRNISFDIEPILLIEEEDKSGFLENISQYGEVVYAK